MKWCEAYQCWCDDLDDILDPEDQIYCMVMSCDDCENSIELKERESND